MQAPDLETLYDIENAVETAAQTVLAALDVPAFTQQQPDDLPGRRVNIQLRLGQPTNHKSQVTPGQFALDAWNATLGFEIWTPRLTKTLNGQADGPPNPDYDPLVHGRFRARVRRAIQYFEDRFNETMLPYHCLTYIMERNTEPQVNVDDDADLSHIFCDVKVSFRKGAWPAA